MAALNVIWARMSPSGIIVFDDYGFLSCPGAKIAVDSFFEKERATRFHLLTGQAIVVKP